MLCCALLCVHSGFAIILMGKRELIALFVFPLTHGCCVALPLIFLLIYYFARSEALNLNRRRYTHVG